MTDIVTNINNSVKQFDRYTNEVLVTESANMQFARLFPIVQVPETTETLGDISVGFTGRAGLNTGKLGEVIPTVGVVYGSEKIQVWDLAFKIAWEDRDIRATNDPQSPYNVSEDLALAGGDAYSKSLFELAMTGNGIQGVNGLATLPTGDETDDNSNTLVRTTAADKTIALSTGAEILGILNAGYSAIQLQTGETRFATRIVMSTAAYMRATTEFVGTSSETALAAFNRNLREQGKPVPLTVGSIAITNEILFYDADPRVLRMLMAQPLRYTDPDRQDNGYTRVGKYRFSGLQVRNGLAMHKITATG